MEGEIISKHIDVYICENKTNYIYALYVSRGKNEYILAGIQTIRRKYFTFGRNGSV